MPRPGRGSRLIPWKPGSPSPQAAPEAGQARRVALGRRLALEAHQGPGREHRSRGPQGDPVQEVAAGDRAEEAQLAVAAVGHTVWAQYQPIGCSLRLMWTCLTWRYSSAPQGPSSRPMPLIL